MNDKLRATWIKPINSTDSTVVPASVQLLEKKSLLNYYKSFIHLRNTSYALTYGKLVPVNISMSPSVCAFVRSDENESLLVVHNLSNENQVLSLPTNLQDYSAEYFANKKAQIKNKQIQIPGYSTVILKKTL